MTIMTTDEELLKIAHTLADTAGTIARTYFRKNPQTTMKESTLKTGALNNEKSPKSPVTEADLAIETALRAYLREHLPTHGILGEEYGLTEAKSEYLWVIDPIDGTTSFTCGKPTFCTLIACLKNDKPLLGIIDQPITHDRWVGVRGQTTTWNGQPCLVKDDATPAEDAPNLIRFSCTTPEMFKTPAQQKTFAALRARASVMSYGGDAYAYGLLAGGHIDVILEADLQYYDVAALIPIIEGAGGSITDWQGRPLEREGFLGEVLACGAQATLH
jgi:histidinol phosphatase-like enzyme (inositol monophosphatase family)